MPFARDERFTYNCRTVIREVRRAALTRPTTGAGGVSCRQANGHVRSHGGRAAAATSPDLGLAGTIRQVAMGGQPMKPL